MDIAQVKDVLRRAVHQFEMDELSDLRESELDDIGGDGENEENVEVESVEGDGELVDEESTGKGPTDEELNGIEEDIEECNDDVAGESVMASYLSFLSELSMSIAEETGVTDDEAWDAMTKVVKQIDGLGSLPDEEFNTADEIKEWMSAAKSNDLSAMAVELIGVQSQG